MLKKTCKSGVYLLKWLNTRTSANMLTLNTIQDGPFWDCSRMWRQKGSLPNTCHKFPTMMKLGAVIPYLRKFQKAYNSRDTPL